MSENLSDLDLDPNPHPEGELAIQTVALSRDVDKDGQIPGGWLAWQMDTAADLASSKVARGKVATVAIENISFLSPIPVGSTVSCYTRVRGVGRSSVKVEVEAWVTDVTENDDWTKVAVGDFVFVAMDDNGRTRAIPK